MSSSAESEKTIKFQKRLKINKNTSHDCVVDMHIKSLSLWKIDKKKQLCTLILYIVSLGTLYIAKIFFPNLHIILSCVPSEIDDAEYIQITDSAGHKSVEILINNDLIYSDDNDEPDILSDSTYGHLNDQHKKINNNRISKREKKSNNTNDIMKKIKSSLYYYRNEIIGEEEKFPMSITKKLAQKNEMKYDKTFEYLRYKYRYDHKYRLFIPVNMYLNYYLKTELIQMKEGIQDKDVYNYLRKIYGKNEIQLKESKFLKTFFTEFKKAKYLYIIVSIIIWSFNDYWNFGILIGFLTIILVLKSTIRKMETSKRIVSNDGEKKVNVKRPFNNSTNQISNIKTSDIVPGDSIILEKTDPNVEFIKVPCDGIILEGYCTVNESDLTGENNLVFRKEIKNENNNEYFSYMRERNSLLYQGTLISSLYSPNKKKSQITMLATDIGYNTYRGNMIKNWEYQNPRRKILNCDYIILGIVSLLLWILSVVLFFIFNTQQYNKEEQSYVSVSYVTRFKSYIDIITVVLPPTLPICVSFGRLFFNHKLKSKNISCVVDGKIDSAGRVDLVVLDKTGTLTESKLGIHCFKTTLENESNQLFLGEEEFTPSILNKIYKKFWQNIYKTKLQYDLIGEKMNASYQIQNKYILIYFTECLATCHCLYRINNENFGNSLDKRLFEEINWEIIQEKEDINSNIIVQPHNSYKITENTIFSEQKEKNTDQSDFYLYYLERYEFSSQFQSMTVVVENSIDKSIRVYTKGAPEKIKDICDQDTLPLDFDMKLREYTSRGFRVLACASKLLNSFDRNKHKREHLECNMVFLGLIVFQNQIKKDTKMYIEHLQEAKCKLVIATGDNVLTTVSVAQQCGILHNDDSVYNIETIDDKETPSLVLTYTNYLDNSHNSINRDNIISSDYYYTSSRSISNQKSFQYQKVFYENENFSKFMSQIKSIIKENKAALCCSGSALELIKKKCDDLENEKTKMLYEQLILKKGKIFYRMLPDNKSALINFFKKDRNNVVAMCGDGANDCSAFMASDVGVAIKQGKGNALTSHFYYTKESIGCLEDIIKNGRACFENRILIIKFMMLYSCIQITSVLFTTVNKQEMNVTQYIFMDGMCVLFPIMIASRTMADFRLSKKKPPKILFNKNFTFSVLGQVSLQIGSQLGFGYFIKGRTLDCDLDIPRNEMNILTTYVYLFSLFQYITVLLVFNSKSIHRQPFYSNSLYMFYLSGIIFICILFIGIKEMPGMLFGLNLILFETDSSNFEMRLESNKAFTILWIMGTFVISILFETLVFKLFKNESSDIQNYNNNTEKDNNENVVE